MAGISDEQVVPGTHSQKHCPYLLAAEDVSLDKTTLICVRFQNVFGAIRCLVTRKVNYVSTLPSGGYNFRMSI